MTSYKRLTRVTNREITAYKWFIEKDSELQFVYCKYKNQKKVPCNEWLVAETDGSGDTGNHAAAKNDYPLGFHAFTKRKNSGMVEVKLRKVIARSGVCGRSNVVVALEMFVPKIGTTEIRPDDNSNQ